MSGVTYFTIQEGIWSSPEESGKLYGKIYNTVTPLVKENVPKELVNEVSPILMSQSGCIIYLQKDVIFKWMFMIF